ncbi:unnamed protein product [Pieris brassicae]|uniref:Uncharacterized protein n=1 Tax=Pieris brassicae TaxID=7116 RepID=A0A9P0XHE9_PIEBR|nr:unnamed protein product [Pieris brassicae]
MCCYRANPGMHGDVYYKQIECIYLTGASQTATLYLKIWIIQGAIGLSEKNSVLPGLRALLESPISSVERTFGLSAETSEVP